MVTTFLLLIGKLGGAEDADVLVFGCGTALSAFSPRGGAVSVFAPAGDALSANGARATALSEACEC